MKIRWAPQNNSESKWSDAVGASPAVFIEEILKGGWATDPSPASVLLIEELKEVSFGLGFTFFEDDVALEKFKLRRPPHYSWRDEASQFDIIFNYNSDPRNLRLRQVYFRHHQRMNMGTSLLRATASLALQRGINNIFVEPGLEGSWFWVRRGALLQKWIAMEDMDIDLQGRAQKILQEKNRLAIGWSDADFTALETVCKTRDCLGLSKLAARDDLFVRNQDGVPIPFCRFWLEDTYLNSCIIALNHPWSQTCLLKRAGLDVVDSLENKFLQKPDIPKFMRSRGISPFAIA